MAWLSLLCGLVAVTTAVVGLSGDHLEDALDHYETLHHSDLRVNNRVRRSLGGPSAAEKDISFSILNKNFHLRLYVERGLFAKTFRAHRVDANNVKDFLNIDRANFLQGHLLDTNGTSRVHAYFEGKDLMATITTQEDTYVIEPSWRHLKQSDQYSMIAYRKSDLQMAKKSDPEGHMGHSFCGYVHADGEDEAAYSKRYPQNDLFNGHFTSDEHKSGRRVKRATSSNPDHDTCTLHLVADYHFYRSVGGNSDVTSANYLVGQIQKVNEIYRNTNFQGYTNMGFEIKEMTIYSAPTAVGSGEVHHNMEKTTWATKDLLKSFSRNPAFGGACLGHLFTSISFSDGVLGLGWIASSKSGSVGGICSPASGGYYYNTAWSTMVNKYGRRILTQESEIVTAHEFGHNWGSQHDPETAECAPSSFSGGKYAMYTYSVSGYESNNDKFSPCSTRTMATVLATKSTSCFTRRSTNFCGNKQVESQYEECDAGLNANDPCCDDNCKLKTGATCSSENSVCCSNCQPAAAGLLCRDTSGLEITCEGNATCDGTSSVCPSNTNKPDGTACIDNGVCSSGQCLSFCESQGKVSCACDSLAQSCYTCCKTSASNSTCEPILVNGTVKHLSDGKPCLQGRCNAGVCEKLVVQLTDRLWSIIENISIDTLAVFMKNNIVATAIILSLLIYLPCSIIVACVDWRREKKDEEEVKWHSKDNNTLYLDKDQAQIRHTYSRKRPTNRSDSNGRGSGASSVRTNKIYPQL